MIGHVHFKHRRSKNEITSNVNAFDPKTSGTAFKPPISATDNSPDRREDLMYMSDRPQVDRVFGKRK